MTAIGELKNMIGKWQGTNHLWLSPEDPVHKSESMAEMEIILQGQFNEFRYSWAFEGKPAEGRLLLGLPPDQTKVQAVWFDSWHMRDQFMICEGFVSDEGAVIVQGSYAAPPDPDWGWQITLQPTDQDELIFLMHNISPEGQKMLAVEVVYSRYL